MAVVRVRVNPDDITKIILDMEDNSPKPFEQKSTGTRFSDAETASWQEFVLTIPDATRAFKVGDVVDVDPDPVTVNYWIRLGSTWFKITNGVSQGTDATVRAVTGYTYMGNIGSLKP